MSIIQAIIQGIVQGATEFLPVSSSGHLSLAQHFMGVTVDSLLFDVMLHLGTLFAVLVVYRNLILRLLIAFGQLIRDLFTGRFRWSRMDPDRNLLVMLVIGLLPLFLLFLPIPGTGMKIKDFADLWATDNDIIVEGCALVVTSILLTLGIIATKKQSGGKRGGKVSGRRSFRVPDAVAVGMAQCVAAVFPGLSRSGSTLSVGLMRGISRQTALDYSFILGIPAIVAAAALELKDAINEPMTVGLAPILAGIITSAVVGFLAIKLLRWMVASDKLAVFVWYTLVLGIIVIILGILEHQAGYVFSLTSWF